MTFSIVIGSRLQVEVLIDRLKLADHIKRVELYNLMNSKLEAAQKGGDGNEFFDFELFATVICDLYDERAKMNEVWCPTAPDLEHKPCMFWQRCWLVFACFDFHQTHQSLDIY